MVEIYNVKLEIEMTDNIKELNLKILSDYSKSHIRSNIINLVCDLDILRKYKNIESIRFISIRNCTKSTKLRGIIRKFVLGLVIEICDSRNNLIPYFNNIDNRYVNYTPEGFNIIVQSCDKHEYYVYGNLISDKHKNYFNITN